MSCFTLVCRCWCTTVVGLLGCWPRSQSSSALPLSHCHLAGVFFRREERCNHIFGLTWRCCLLARRDRVLSLRCFSAHPVMCAMFHRTCFAMMCVAHKPLGFLRHHHSCVFCVYDLHQPLSYGCWYQPICTLWFSQPKGMRRIYVIHHPLGYWCRARPAGHALHLRLPPALGL